VSTSQESSTFWGKVTRSKPRNIQGSVFAKSRNLGSVGGDGEAIESVHNCGQLGVRGCGRRLWRMRRVRRVSSCVQARRSPNILTVGRGRQI
jgi:hypothetical protein